MNSTILQIEAEKKKKTFICFCFENENKKEGGGKILIILDRRIVHIMDHALSIYFREISKQHIQCSVYLFNIYSCS